MIDAKKYPKAAKLQEQREEKFETEKTRQKDEARIARKQKREIGDLHMTKPRKED